MVAAAALSCVCWVGGAAPAMGGQEVDPSTLTPAPPPGATCVTTGDAVRCATTFDASLQAEPVFTLPCGQVYETSTDVRRGIRWYVDGRLDRRFVFQTAGGSWSLSPTMSAPVVTWVAHASWQNLDIDADAPEETWPTTTHGLSIRVTGPDGRTIFQYAGLDLPDGTHHGIGDWAELESAEVQAALCDVLTS
jgi:hypothetical protein